MEKNKWAKWERQRARGKKRFILQMAFYFGLSWLLLMTCLHHYVMHEPFMQALSANLILAPILGYFMGLINWNLAENAYKKSHPNSPAHPPLP